MGKNCVDLIFTDPPYNISNNTKIFRDYRSGKHADISFNFGEWDYNSYNINNFITETKDLLVNQGSYLIFCSEQQMGEYRQAFKDHGIYMKQVLIWIKTNPLPQFRKTAYRQSTEMIIWGMRGKNSKDNPNFIFREQSQMVNYFYAPIVGGKERLKHPTQKPLSICKQLIKTHCRPEGIVLDCFSGVGTIGIAANQTGRKFIAIEKDKKYHDMAVHRYQNIDEYTSLADLKLKYPKTTKQRIKNIHKERSYTANFEQLEF